MAHGGQIAHGFEPVARAFRRLVGRNRGGGALAVRLRGETVVDLWTGYADRHETRPWTPDTLAISFSTTKGVASTVIHRLADRGELDYDEPVAAYWPEFAVGGKEDVTVRHLLTHRAGLQSVRAVADRAEDLLDHVGLEDKLAARTVRAPTERSAYHAITYGWLVAGLARRITGRGLAELARIEVTEPLGIKGLHIGVPDEAREFVAEPFGAALRQAWCDRRSHRAAVDALPGDPHADRRSAHVPAFTACSRAPIRRSGTPRCRRSTGVISARALAELYEPFANGGEADGKTFLSAERL